MINTYFRKESITLLSDKNQFTFSPAGEDIALFTTSEFTTPMLDELDKSGIVEVEHYTYTGETGTIRLCKKIGFENEKFTRMLVYIIEKYGL